MSIPTDMRMMPPLRLTVLAAWVVFAVFAPVAGAQVGQLVSPGPLSRAHTKLEGIGNCEKCHRPGQQVAGSRCLACHKPIAERIAARKGVHRDVKENCARCHGEHGGLDADLRPLDTQKFNHAAETGFMLDGRHAPLARACAKCHKTRSFLGTQTACASCHKDVHKGGLGPNCASCHPTAVAFADARQRFDHSRAKFALAGAHRNVECAKCHVNKVYTGLKFALCADCHREPHRPSFNAACTNCHTVETWKTQKLDHARTGFPLKGAHATISCTSCHVRSAVQVRLKAARCSDCHSDVHRGQFKQDCSTCHSEVTFKKATFDHAASARFALTGKHAGVACVKCHKGASAGTSPRTVGAAATASIAFRGASPACASCHEDVHRGATVPQCETCHGTSAFRGVTAYTHPPALAVFLAGRHAGETCAACHGRTAPIAIRAATRPAGAAAAAAQPAAAIGAWRFKAIGTACASCHADPHGAQFGTGCERCHAVDEPGFKASRFPHASTAFPLTGRHTTTECAKCHKPDATVGAPRTPVRYKGVGTACVSCHQDVHLGQLGARCDSCHATSDFKLPRYVHKNGPGARTLVGSHAKLACQACHKPEKGQFPAGAGTAVKFTGFGAGCATCHAQKDAHRGALGSACENCHTPEHWPSASRAFHKNTVFPLEGRHLVVACASCHQNGVIKGTPTKCIDCHWVRRQDDPYHTQLGTQCEDCHKPTAWTSVNWNHGARTGFTINLAHQLLRCDSCHKDGRFAGANINCVSCHLAAFQQTSQPAHAAAGFPTNCEVCHKPAHATWHEGVFNHASRYPLVGVHTSQACSACHRNSVFKGTPTDCVGCHLPAYLATKNPNHTAAGIPTTCVQCHRQTDPTWSSGVPFNHASAFPLVGLHATQACAACHKNGVYKGTPRDCVGCHLANYQGTKNPNHAAAGFPTTCDTCHKPTDAAWTGATFNHSQFFPLLGRHLSQPCSACHQNNLYKGTPTACVACHLANYQRTTTPNHTAAGFPTACETCHKASDSAWTQGTFNHTRFPITSGRHAGNPCSACHTTANVFAVFSCTTGCHVRASIDSHHGSVNGYRYDSAACYSCHPAGVAGAPRP